ncbi:MAG: DNA repair protein RecO, partial [Patescibacteria group bacterium]|nr:DNA repair protein RecO [Patescibacteria group bacterium]
MPTYRDKGVVLKIQPLRDADRRYSLFTAEHGKIDLLAKGTRRGHSKMSPHLGTFGVVEVMVARGRRWDRLAGASLERSFSRLIESFPGTAAAQGFLLTVDALTRRELPDDRVFRLVVDYLEALDGVASTDVERQLYAGGVVKLLDLLGFAPEFDVCLRCRAVLVPDGNAVDFLRGGLLCTDCFTPEARPVSPNFIKAMRFLRREEFPAIAALRFDAYTASEIDQAIDTLLAIHAEDRLAAWDYVRRWA